MNGNKVIHSDKKLFIQAIGKYLSGLILISMLLFISAGTLNYWNAWLLIGVLFIPMLITGIVLALKNPVLLRKRLSVYAFGTWFFILVFYFFIIPGHYGQEDQKRRRCVGKKLTRIFRI